MVLRVYMYMESLSPTGLNLLVSTPLQFPWKPSSEGRESDGG